MPEAGVNVDHVELSRSRRPCAGGHVALATGAAQKGGSRPGWSSASLVRLHALDQDVDGGCRGRARDVGGGLAGHGLGEVVVGLAHTRAPVLDRGGIVELARLLGLRDEREGDRARRDRLELEVER
jgi:hypothetical protein